MYNNYSYKIFGAEKGKRIYENQNQTRYHVRSQFIRKRYDQSGAQVFLTDKNRDYIVSAKSLLGAVYSMEWDEIWCESDENIYHLVSKYAADE